MLSKNTAVSTSVNTINKEDMPLLKRFEEIKNFVGTEFDSSIKLDEAKKWYEENKKDISNVLIKTIAKSPKGSFKFRVKISLITYGSGKLSQDVLELIIKNLAITGYECDIRSSYMYFSPMNR